MSFRHVPRNYQNSSQVFEITLFHLCANKITFFSSLIAGTIQNSFLKTASHGYSVPLAPEYPQILIFLPKRKKNFFFIGEGIFALELQHDKNNSLIPPEGFTLAILIPQPQLLAVFADKHIKVIFSPWNNTFVFKEKNLFFC